MSASVRLSVSDALKAWLDRGAAEAGFATADAYALDVLMRAQRVAAARERVDHLLTESMESGPSVLMDKDDWARIREKARKLSQGKAST